MLRGKGRLPLSLAFGQPAPLTRGACREGTNFVNFCGKGLPTGAGVSFVYLSLRHVYAVPPRPGYGKPIKKISHGSSFVLPWEVFVSCFTGGLAENYSMTTLEMEVQDTKSARVEAP